MRLRAEDTLWCVFVAASVSGALTLILGTKWWRAWDFPHLMGKLFLALFGHLFLLLWTARLLGIASDDSLGERSEMARRTAALTLTLLTVGAVLYWIVGIYYDLRVARST
jgi:hypothetical protein